MRSDGGLALLAARRSRSTAPSYDGRVEALVAIGAAELVDGLGLMGVPLLDPALRRLARPFSRPFARTMASFDAQVAAHGLAGAGAWIVGRMARGLEATGVSGVPRTGPLVVVANHPGVLDAAAIFAALDRPDLRVIARERPFLRALPATAGHLIVLPEEPRPRLSALREAALHLRGGGAILTFPAGRIEPDPALDAPGAVASLATWPRGLASLLRLAPPARLLPVIVAGVLSARALRHPLTGLRRGTADRQRLAAMLQVIRPPLQEITVRVGFGTVRALGREGARVSDALPALLADVSARIEAAALQPNGDQMGAWSGRSAASSDRRGTARGG